MGHQYTLQIQFTQPMCYMNEHMDLTVLQIYDKTQLSATASSHVNSKYVPETNVMDMYRWYAHIYVPYQVTGISYLTGVLYICMV